MTIVKTKSNVEKRLEKKKKKNALVFCQDGKQFWTTQAQFWQWVRDHVIVKVSDGPLSGRFIQPNEEYFVMISNTILNVKCPNHMQEVLYARRKALQ
ncbi:MAG TPA: hypothetical protein VK468_11125 [Pyrinomonadaceae bacterium]|nr:hypothetical protein [Pyrinomonadaceae bacterium]